MNLVLIGMYLFMILLIFGFIAIVVMHIGIFRQYSKYLSIVLKIYLVTILLIAIFGGYKILTGTYISPAKSAEETAKKIDF